MKKKPAILVIRLGALGDLVFCLQAFYEIRQIHKEAHIALLTRAPFADFARAMPYFDEVIIDPAPRFTDIGDWLRLRRAVKKLDPTRVYDLQGKNRQSILYALLGGPLGPQWSGAAPYCALPRVWPPIPGMSFSDFLAAQLRVAGVPHRAPADLGWLDAPVETFILPARYAVLIPGCSPGARHKRWPHYAELAEKLRTQNMECVIVGTRDDAEAAQEIKKHVPLAIDLCGKTDLFQLAGILRRAVCAIGNDTGPMHMAAALGVPTLALFSGTSDPVWSRPPGTKVAVLQKQILEDLSVDEVGAALQALLQHTESAG